jgi:hypothetical protein
MYKILTLILCATFVAAMADAPNEIQLPLSSYLQAMNGGQPPKDGSHFQLNLPVLEIFDAQGVPIYYSTSSKVAIPELHNLHGKLSTLKAVSGHERLSAILQHLNASGVTVPNQTSSMRYTFLFIRSDRPGSNPEINEQEAILKFLREERKENIHLVKLVISGIN